MNNKIVLSSLAMDLERVALGYYRKSFIMADRFLEEALKRSQEIDRGEVKPHIAKVLNEIESLRLQKDKDKAAEDALLYSTLLQNAAISKNL